MKFLRVGEFGKEIPAVLDDENKIRDLSSIIKDLSPENLNFEILDKINFKADGVAVTFMFIWPVILLRAIIIYFLKEA